MTITCALQNLGDGGAIRSGHMPIAADVSSVAEPDLAARVIAAAWQREIAQEVTA